MSSAKYPVLRQTLIALSFAALVGLFFTLNLFFIIPKQQQTYNNKVFRVLNELATDFGKRIEGQAEYRINNAAASSKDSARHVDSCDSTLKRKLFAAFGRLSAVTDSTSKRFAFYDDTVRVTANRLNPETLITFGIPIQKLVAPSAEWLHQNLFDLILLVKRDSFFTDKKLRYNETVLYRYGRLATGALPAGDSLVNDRRFGQFSTIDEVTIAGTDYKTFTLPFRFGGQDLVLLGFIREAEYRFAATGYSKPLVLGVVVTLVFLILSLPLIKIYLSSRQERINTNDVRWVIVVMTAAPFFFMLIVSGLLAYLHIDEESNENLCSLHRQVERNLNSEIRLALDQLKQYDSLLNEPDSTVCNTYNRHLTFFAGREGGADLRDVLFYPDAFYRNLDNVQWIDGRGHQIAKWFNSDSVGLTYLDVSKRAYYQKLRKGQGFVNTGDSFYVEPIVSWSTGLYTVNLVKPSRQIFPNRRPRNDTARAVMIGLTARLYSVCDPVLPKGYQFCIIDEGGRILFHSQTERSLHENLFDESDASLPLRNAVFKKETAFIPDVQLFDRDVKMRVAPMDGLPSFYLVTYFTKRERNLFVYHASTFTLLCVSISLFLLVVLLALFSVLDAARARPKYGTYDTAWMQPTVARNSLYKRIIAHQLQTVALALLLLGLLTLFTSSGYWFLFEASMALPFYVATSYYFLANNHNLVNDPAALKKANRKIWWVYLPFIAVFVAGINYLQYRNESGGKINWTGVAFIALLSLLVPFFAAFQQRLRRQKYKWRRWMSGKADESITPETRQKILKSPWYKVFFGKPRWLYSRNYGVNYKRAIRFSIFVVAVLPVVGVMSFGLNEESKMQIKAAQFYTARQIEDRRNRLNDYFASTKLHLAAEKTFIERRKLDGGFGIYFFQDTLTPVKRNTGNHAGAATVGNSDYYQTVTQFLFLPKDHTDFFSDTRAYQWTQGPNGGEINLTYNNETDAVTPADVEIHHVYRGHLFLLKLFKNVAGFLLLLIILAYFIFHFTLVGTVAKKIFLLDYFRFDDEAGEANGVRTTGIAWVNGFYKTLSLHKADRLFLQLKEHPGLFATKQEPVTSDAVTAAEARNPGNEEVILRLQYMLAPAYDAMWNALKPEEKYLLHDFALDGFTNYKNVDLLYGMYRKGLIQKKDHRLELMNASFRSYLLAKSGGAEIGQLQKELDTGSTWKSLKNILLILFFATLVFLFATQQDVSNKIIAIVSGLATLVPLLLKIFDRSGASGDAKK